MISAAVCFFYRSDGVDMSPLQLSLLSPLWVLYQSVSDTNDREKTTPLQRALTELFLVAEDSAEVGLHT